jgi:hypothetical protein
MLGVKITHLREGWNHILRRDKKPMPMSRAQEEVPRPGSLRRQWAST